MALPSAYSSYSTVQNAYQQFLANPTGSGGTGTSTSTPTGQLFDRGVRDNVSGSGGSPINYGQTIPSLRQQPDVTNISTFGDLSPSERISTLADRKYQELEATRLANEQFARSSWDSNLKAVGGLSKSDQGFIFNTMRNTGLVPQSPTQAGTAEYKFRQQNPWYQQNLNTMGIVNRANLAGSGIDPNSITKAYQEFLGKRY